MGADLEVTEQSDPKLRTNLQDRRVQCQKHWPKLLPVLDQESLFLLYAFLRAFLWG